jgi:hypothetical protein
MKEPTMKRLVIISDTHCGHRFGLTPSDWQTNDKDGFLGKASKFQKELWKWYEKEIASCKLIDLIVVNGDLIDGKGSKSGGTELITTDRLQQCEMAIECIKIAKAKSIMIINGTPYHTGNEEDFEVIIASELKAKYCNHAFIDVGGVKFDIRHKVGTSNVPYSRNTAPQKDAMWNSLLALKGIQPDCDVVVRSHAHYYAMAEDDRKMSIITPALQGYTKYGSRECIGSNTLGFLQFDCGNSQFEITKHFFDMKPFAAEVEVY